MSGGLDVALLNPTFWPEVRRGSERVIRDLADGLLERGHRPELLTSHPGGTTRQTEGGLPVLRRRRPRMRWARAAGLHEHTGHAWGQYRDLRRGDYAIAHAFFPADAVAAVRWARSGEGRSVFSVMGIPSRERIESNPVRRAIWRRGLDGADAVVALSDVAAAALADLGVRARVIPPGVDLEVFRPTGRRSSPPIVLCPADLSDPRKRAGLLFEAFAIARGEIPGTRMVLSRQSDPGVVAAAAEIGAEMMDLDDTRDLVRAYGQASVTVLASRAEAFGLVLAESLACGTPVVGADDGGVPDVVGDAPVGRLFGGGAAELAEAIVGVAGLSEDPSTAAACRARAEEMSSRAFVDRYLDLYLDLAGR